MHPLDWNDFWALFAQAALLGLLATALIASLIESVAKNRSRWRRPDGSAVPMSRKQRQDYDKMLGQRPWVTSVSTDSVRSR